MKQQAKVRVPATVGNLGPGIDVLGLALDLYNHVEIITSDLDADLIEVTDDSQADIDDSYPLDDTNYAFRGAVAAFHAAGRKAPPFSLKITQNIPVARGLGSSAAALVGGAMAARAILDEELSTSELTFALTHLEGHIEQLAAALDGGLVAAAPKIEGISSISSLRATPAAFALNIDENLVFVAAVPDVKVQTKAARDILPAQVTFQDAVFNIAAATALCAGLAEGDPFLLRLGTHDKLHQDLRAELCPAVLDVISAARDFGAMGACLSGSGPTVLAICDGPDSAQTVAEEMVTAFKRNKIAANHLICGTDFEGATVTELDNEPYTPPDYDQDDDDMFLEEEEEDYDEKGDKEEAE